MQGEFNLHNIGSYWVNRLLALGFLVYVGLWPAVGYWYPQLHCVLDRMSMPIAPLAFLPIGLIALAMDDHDVITRFWRDPEWRLSEGRELLFSANMLMLAVLMKKYRRNGMNGTDSTPMDTEVSSAN